MAELSDEASRKRMLKASGIKDAAIERGKQRLPHSLLCRFGSQFAPNRLIRGARFWIDRFARKRLAARDWKIGLHSDLTEGPLAERVSGNRNSLADSRDDFSQEVDGRQVKNKSNPDSTYSLAPIFQLEP